MDESGEIDMCLILFAYQQHPRYKLVLAANRDEFYNRPSLPAGFWQDCPQVFGGRDLEQGGSWMGVSRNGKMAAVTNYRDPASHNPQAKTRGALVSSYLCGAEQAADYVRGIDKEASLYNGFNLLAADKDSLWYYSNRQRLAYMIPPGIHGLSNHLLNTAWPKVTLGKRRVAGIMELPEPEWEDAFMRLLTDQTQPAEAELPQTGVAAEWERALAPVFITSPTYGTRTNTLLLIDYNRQMHFIERTYHPDTQEWDRREILIIPEN